MAVLAGETIIAGKVPGERIGTDIVTANSAGITTTETVIQDITVALVTGRIYRITTDFGFSMSATASTDNHIIRIREDNVSGTQLQARRAWAGTTALTMPMHFECEYTAASTGNKTFVVTALRSGSGGTFTMIAASDTPAYLHVEYVRGP